MHLALITGGYSGESVISYLTAETLMKHWPSAYPKPIVIDIRKDGWFARFEGKEIAVDKNNFTVKLPKGIVHFKAAIIALHGAPGEDGKLQGYFDMLNIPYTTGNVLNMALTFNKKYTTSFLAQQQVSCAKSILVQQKDALDTTVTRIKNTLELPLFVKPNAGGSSIGITMVKQWDTLKKALEDAFKEDTNVIVENFLDGMEVGCGVLPMNGTIQALPPTEIVSANDFFDYKAKYHKESEEITPARLPEEDIKCIQAEAVRIYKLLNCKGIIRIDFKYLKNKPQVIEVNTVPGMSAESIVPQQLASANIPLTDAIKGIIDQALAG